MAVFSRFLAIMLFSACTVAGQTVSTLVSGSTFNDGLALDREGNIYASLYYGTTVTKITPGGQATIFATGLSSPNGLTFGPDGDLYVPNATGNSISRITPDGTRTTFLTITDPATALFNGDGTLLVTHYNLNKISLVDTNLAVSDFLVGGELDGPIGLVRDPNGILYIGNFNDGRIFRFTAASGLEVIGDIPGWLGFMTLAGDAIYATGWQDNRIYKVPLDGSGAQVFAGTGALGSADGPVGTATFSIPNGIVATPTGDTLYISDYSSRSLRMITGVNTSTDIGDADEQIQGFHLHQNYPNPFNPTTTVRFRVPVTSQVSIIIYDVIGNQVASLVNDRVTAGEHEAVFDGKGLSSGVYVARMLTGAAVQTQMMLLLK